MNVKRSKESRIAYYNKRKNDESLNVFKRRYAKRRSRELVKSLVKSDHKDSISYEPPKKYGSKTRAYGMNVGRQNDSSRHDYSNTHDLQHVRYIKKGKIYKGKVYNNDNSYTGGLSGRKFGLPKEK